MYSYKEKGNAVKIEPPPPSPSTCRLCARSSRTLFRPQTRGDVTWVPSVFGESRPSCRLSNWARSNSGSQQQQYEYTSIRAASQTSSTILDDGSHPPHRPSPMPLGELLAEDRASAGLYATASVFVCSSWTGVPWMRCDSRVLYDTSTAAVGRVLCYILKYRCK